MASLVTEMLCLDFDFDLGKEQYLEKETSLFKKTLHSVAHVENLTLGSWRIEVYSYSSLSEIEILFKDSLFTIGSYFLVLTYFGLSISVVSACQYWS